MRYFYIVILILNFAVFLVGAIRYKKAGPAFKLLVVYVAATFLCEGASDILAKTVHNNMPVYHAFAPVEYLLYTLIYRQVFGGKVKQVITYAIIPVLAWAVINTAFIQKTSEFPSNFVLFYQVLFLIYALLGFRQMLLQPSKKIIYREGFFWLNIALMFFSTTLFLYFGLLNYSVRHHLNILPVVYFVFVVNVIYNILLAVAIIADTNPPTNERINEYD